MSSDVQRRVIIFCLVLVGALLFLAPTFLRDIVPQKWISKPISLGLDLSGGVHLVYRVQTEEAVKTRYQSIANAIRADLRKDTSKIAVTRARATEQGQIEITLFSDRSSEDAKRVIEENYKNLTFVEKGNDGDRVKLVYKANQSNESQIASEAVDQAVEKLRNRVDQFGVAEPLIQKQGVDRILLQMPGVTDIESVKKIVGKVAKLEFHLMPQPGSSQRTATFKDRKGGAVQVEEEALMAGDAVDNATVDFHDNGVEVSLALTSEGAETFRKITTDNVGRELAIILDGMVYSHPVIREPIAGGRASISGGFTLEEARQLKIVLKAGALPAPLEVMEERTVGPSLGKESITKGITAMLIGCALVFVFMVFYYRKSGFMAVGTLILNVVLLLAALSAFGATLTLPGLAGLALTVGMAVDANVIIFERIRDELRLGAGRDAAVASGFDKALRGIVDANVTHLIAGTVLYIFGTGPIRGFAVTLCLGILSTIFCAVFVAKLGFEVFELKAKDRLSI